MNVLGTSPGTPEPPRTAPGHLAGLGPGEFPRGTRLPARPATRELGRAHDPTYAECAPGSRPRFRHFDPDTYFRRLEGRRWGPAVAWTLRARSCGGSRRRFGLPRRRASRDPPTAMGFCIFNNIAVATAALLADGRTVLIFDSTCHHGNGTRTLLGDPRSCSSRFTCGRTTGRDCMTESAAMPARATRSRPLPHGTGNASTLAVDGSSCRWPTASSRRSVLVRGLRRTPGRPLGGLDRTRRVSVMGSGCGDRPAAREGAMFFLEGGTTCVRWRIRSCDAGRAVPGRASRGRVTVPGRT